MRGVFNLLAMVVILVTANPVAGRETKAISEPQDVASPPLSWVCLNPQTRQYQALEAPSLREAQKIVGGDDRTQCREIPVALDPERVAYDLNTREQPQAD
jgi:hypothetical protein